MKLKQTLLFQDLGDETVVVPVGEAAEALHGLLRVNKTGAAIIRALVDGKGEEGAAAQLVEDFDGVDPARAREAVSRIVGQLREAGLTDE